jgi:sugar lactone lactonase YvrE
MGNGHEVEHLLGVQNRLGEGPRWNAGEQKLYWVDIEQHFVYRYDPATARHERFDVGQPVGALGFRQGGGLVLALRDGLALWDTDWKEPQIIAGAGPERGKEGARFNDGATDRMGRFWAGTLYSEATSCLYRLDPDHSLHTMVRNVTISNGIGWSPDNKTMYYTDTQTRTIYAYDYDAATGNIENRRNFVHTPDERDGYPDGLTVDSHGFVWSACWSGWRVVRYDPEGNMEREIRLPVSLVTACTFGGPDLTDLYITSAWTGLSEEERQRQPRAGDLFVLRTGIRGIEEPEYRG